MRGARNSTISKAFRPIAVFAFIVALIGQPQKAFADAIDAPFLAAIQILQQAGNALMQQLQSAGNVTKILSDQLKSTLDVNLQDTAIASREMETRRAMLMQHGVAFAMIVPGSTDPNTGATVTGNDFCYRAAAIQSTRSVNEALMAFAADHADALKFANTGTGPLADAAWLKERCDRSLADSGSSGRNGALLQKMGGSCAQPPQYLQFVDADLKPSTVLNKTQYPVPVGAKIDANSGQLILPKAADVQNVNEMQFIAAVYACRMFRRSLPLPPSSATRNPTAEDASVIMAQLRAAAAGSGATGDICAREISRRAQISSQLAQNSPGFQNLYNAQAVRCTAMFKRGVISDATNQDCQTNGMSDYEAAKNEACQYSQFSLINTIAGTGLTVDQVTQQQIEHSPDCQAFFDKFHRENKETASLLLTGFQGPEAAEPNPLAR
jgi:hypothetical protein